MAWLSQISKLWNKFINPKDLQAAFIFTIAFLKLAGLFPYKLGAAGFEISYPAFAITLVHFTAYVYVNVNLLWTDIMALTKPVIMEGAVAVGANLLIRLAGIAISIATFFPIFAGMEQLLFVLNKYVVLMELMADLGLNTSHIFKKMLVMSATSTVVVFVLIAYVLFFSYFFFEKITHETPSMQFYYGLILTNFYKNMCIFDLGSHLFCTYLILAALNGFLEDLLRRQIKDHEAWRQNFQHLSCS